MPGHSSYQVWRIIKDRAIQKVIPSLGKKSNAQTIFSVAMIILALLATIGAGIYIDGYVIHPPQQYTGLCPNPAHISDNSQKCTEPLVSQVVSGTVTKETTIQVPAGTVLIPNATTITKTVTK